MTGAYLRIQRNEKWLSIEIEHLTNAERRKYLKDDLNLLQWLNIVCEELAKAEELLDALVEVGLLIKED